MTPRVQASDAEWFEVSGVAGHDDLVGGLGDALAQPRFIELQGTAEGHAFRRDELDALLGLAETGIRELFALQQQALAQ